MLFYRGQNHKWAPKGFNKFVENRPLCSSWIQWSRCNISLRCLNSQFPEERVCCNNDPCMFASTYFCSLPETGDLITSTFGLTQHGPFHLLPTMGTVLQPQMLQSELGKVSHIWNSKASASNQSYVKSLAQPLKLTQARKNGDLDKVFQKPTCSLHADWPSEELMRNFRLGFW